MKLLSRTLMLAIMVLATSSMFAQKNEPGELKKKVQAINNSMVEAILQEDFDKIMTFYDEKVISMPNYAPMIRGLDEMMEKQEAASESGNKMKAMRLTTKKVSDYGNVLVEIGIYSITMEIAGMPGEITDKGKYLTVWKKYDDGFKILNEIWNTDVNPMLKGAPGDEKPSPADKEKPKPQEQKKPKSAKEIKS